LSALVPVGAATTLAMIAAMALPPLIKQLADMHLTALCDRRSPAELQHEIKVTYATFSNNVTITQHRTAWDNPKEWVAMKVALLVYVPRSNIWTLYCFDRNERRAQYPSSSTSDLASLIAEVDADPTEIIWG